MKRFVLAPLALVGLLTLSLLSMISSGAGQTDSGAVSTSGADDDESDITIVGLHNIRRYCDNTSTSTDGSIDDEGCRKRRRILAAMETDELLKGTVSIRLFLYS